MVKSRCRIPLLLLVLLLPAACGDAGPGRDPAREGPPVVAVSSYPLESLAAAIAGETLQVRRPVPDDADPELWRPTVEEVRVFQDADLIVLNGAGYERWAARVSLPSSRVVDTTADLAASLITIEDTVTHSHGPEGEHAHEGIDPHTWMDPLLAKVQARSIQEALAERWPEHAETFRAGLERVSAELDRLHRELEALSRGGEIHLVASHPAFGYLAKRHGWRITSVDLSPDRPPLPAQVKAMRDIIRDHGVRLLVWEAEPAPEVVAAVKSAAGLLSVLFSTAESPPADGSSFPAVMGMNVSRLKQALAEVRPPR